MLSRSECGRDRSGLRRRLCGSRCLRRFLQFGEPLFQGVQARDQFLGILPAKRLVQATHSDKSNDSEDRSNEQKDDQEEDEGCFHGLEHLGGLNHRQLPETTGLTCPLRTLCAWETKESKCKKDWPFGQVFHTEYSKGLANQNEIFLRNLTCPFSML